MLLQLSACLHHVPAAAEEIMHLMQPLMRMPDVSRADSCASRRQAEPRGSKQEAEPRKKGWVNRTGQNSMCFGRIPLPV